MTSTPTTPRWLHLTLLAALFLAPLLARAQTATDLPLPARPFHVEGEDGARWDVRMTVHHAPFHGLVFYAVPPNDPCQTINSVELFAETAKGRIDAVRVADASPYKKPLLQLSIDAAAAFTVVAHVEVQIHHTKLAAGPPAAKVKPLLPLGRKEYLDDEWPDEKARAWFTQWMKTHSLMRGDEDHAAFAFRVLKFMQQHFRYVIPDKLPDFIAAVKSDPAMGDWHYTLRTGTGECYRISDTYCRIMRMNGVPARLVSGNYVNEQDGHHLRSLIYLADAGWIPVEATASLDKQPALNYFGTWGGPFLAGNRSVNFSLPGPQGPMYIGTLDRLAFGSASGTWDFPPGEITATILSKR